MRSRITTSVKQFEIEDLTKLWDELKGFFQRGSNKGTVKTLLPDAGSNTTKFALEGGTAAIFSLFPEPRDHDY
ncbi:MAG: hypothetical protein OEN00_08260 [Gemmatimonadota bacterium]|nr:hypothetical protein [Gemmatimonadota bacterium]